MSATPTIEDVSPEYLARVADLAENEVRRRSFPRLPVYLVFFLAIDGVTTVSRRHPDGTFWLFAAILLLTLLRIWIAVRWDHFPAAKHARRRILWNFSLHALAAVWGVGAALALLFFELGWTTFVVTLTTCAICASETPALSPALDSLWKYLITLLAPAIAVNLMVVGGLRGFSLALFFVAFMIFLFLQGRVQFREYWARLREHARLLAVIDAVPGTVAWLNSDLVYVGVNRAMAALRGLNAEAFAGQKLGFSDPNSPVVAFAKALFQSKAPNRAIDTRLEVAGGVMRHYYLFGQKYNQDLEAVILGIDMTERAEAAETIMKERAQRLFGARLANLGQVHSKVAPGLAAVLTRALEPTALPDDRARAKRAIDAIEALSAPPGSRHSERFPAARLLEDINATFTETAKSHGIDLAIQIPTESPTLDADRGQLLEVLASLVINAMDAMEKIPGPKQVRVELVMAPGTCSIAVTDSGPGVPEAYRAKIFEPLFTTRAEGASTGMGLSVSVEIIELHGGRLYLDPSSSPGARFVIELPA